MATPVLTAAPEATAAIGAQVLVATTVGAKDVVVVSVSAPVLMHALIAVAVILIVERLLAKSGGTSCGNTYLQISARAPGPRNCTSVATASTAAASGRR